VILPSLLAPHADHRPIGSLHVGLAVQRHPDRKTGRRVVSNDLNAGIDFREANGRYDTLPASVDELIALKPDLIIAEATPAVAAAQKATPTIPIIMAPASDPIGSGVHQSFTHPGGNSLRKFYGPSLRAAAPVQPPKGRHFNVRFCMQHGTFAVPCRWLIGRQQ
jgi:hypothetical protein